MGLKEQLPRLADLHLHTSKSPCAVRGYGVKEVVESARAKGVALVAITDHYHDPSFRKVLEGVREEVEEARSTFGDEVLILWGAEADILTVNGELSIEPEVAERLDILLAGFHFVPAGGRCLPESEKGKVGFNSERFREIVKGEEIWDFVADVRDALLAVVQTGLVSIVAHPLTLFCDLHLADRESGPIRTLFDVADKKFWDELFRTALDLKVCFEVNNNFGPLDARWGGLAEFVRRAASFGVKISTASDAHHPNDAGYLDGALSFLDQLGIPPESIVASPSDFRRPKRE